MKRLYRLPQEKKIAGVCAGLGEYFDLDPVFFRLFFLVLLLFGGVGLLAYIVMWIMVPMKGEAREAAPAKRLHLSRTERKIAGVCGGLGEFLDVDPILFRVMFVVLAFVGGVGIVLYIALWLVMPEESPPVASQPDAPDRHQPDNA
jgi:phage shock protein PspC (stress-responsive transcriptional regulator)